MAILPASLGGHREGYRIQDPIWVVKYLRELADNIEKGLAIKLNHMDLEVQSTEYERDWQLEKLGIYQMRIQNQIRNRKFTLDYDEVVTKESY